MRLGSDSSSARRPFRSCHACRTPKWIGLAVLLVAVNAHGASVESIWAPTSSGNYSDPSKWLPAVVPNNAGGNTFDVRIDFAQVEIDIDGTIDNVLPSTGTVSISDHSFTVLGTSSIGRLLVSAQNADTTVSLGTLARFSADTKTLGSPSPGASAEITLAGTSAHAATLRFKGADIVTNATYLSIGPNARILDENGNDALRHFARND